MATRIKYRRDTASNWTTANPILAAGEPGYELGTKKLKVGDGVTAWNALAYQPNDGDISATYGPAAVLATTRGQEDTRKRIIARVPAKIKVMATPPTVTLSAGNAATSIAGGITRAPKRTTATGADGAPADMVNDPLFSYLGAPVGTATYGTVTPDNVLINWNVNLTGVPSSQLASWQPRIGFQHTGQVFEFLFKGLANPNYYRVMVNGEYVTEDMQQVAIANTGQVYRLIVDFGSTSTRDVIVEVGDLRFGGVTIEPTASLTRLPPQPLRVAGIGDSFFGGAAELRRKASVLEIAAAQLGSTEVWNLGVGGTGYINNGGDGQPYSARIATDLPKTSPTLIILAGGFNDRSSLATDIQAAATTAMNSTKAAFPNALVFVVGCWSAGTPTTAEAAANGAVRAAAAAAGLPFIDVQDTVGLLATAPVYSAALQYRVGDLVNYNGVLYTAVAFSNAVAFTVANWRALSVINGTGKVGTPTANGNADVATQADAIHPTILGGKLLGAFIARRIYEICKAQVLP